MDLVNCYVCAVDPFPTVELNVYFLYRGYMCAWVKTIKNKQKMPTDIFSKKKNEHRFEIAPQTERNIIAKNVHGVT